MVLSYIYMHSLIIGMQCATQQLLTLWLFNAIGSDSKHAVDVKGKIGGHDRLLTAHA